MLVCLPQSTRSAPLATLNLQVSWIISKASNTLIIPIYYPVLLHQINPQTLHDQEVDDEVEPIALFIIKPLGVTSSLLILPCYASRRGLGESIHDRCEIVKLMVYIRWQLKYTSGWIGAPGYSSDFPFFFGLPPRLKGIMRLFMLETSVCGRKLLWALAQLTKLCELLQWQTSRCRGKQV